MTSGLTTGVLDNAVWHAINGPQRSLAEHAGRAGRFLADISPFAALCDDPTSEAWEDLGRLVGPGKATILFAPTVPTHPGWVAEHRIPCLQMVATDVEGTPTRDDFIELESSDVPEMLELIGATQPGPFGTRTIEFGGYLGLRDAGKLVAMTGERLRCPGFAEVSAVCTLPDHRGQGLARELVLAVITGIRARGEEAFLHVATDNTPAIALYEAMGFTVRCEGEAVIVRHAEAS